MGQAARAKAYRWDAMEKDQPMALLERRRIIGELAMLSHVMLRKGCVVPTHSHENEQFACVLSGRMRFGIGDEGGKSSAAAGGDFETMVLEGGQVLHLPSRVPHTAEALEDTVVLDVFCPPSATTGIDGRRG